MRFNDTAAISVAGRTFEILPVLGWVADNTRPYSVNYGSMGFDGPEHLTKVLITFADPNEALLFKIAWADS